MRRNRDRDAVEGGLCLRAEHRSFGLRQVHRRFARPSMGQLHHGLAGGDHLPGFGQKFDDGPVGVREQQRVSGFVSRDISLRFGCRQLRVCGVERPWPGRISEEPPSRPP